MSSIIELENTSDNTHFFYCFWLLELQPYPQLETQDGYRKVLPNQIYPRNSIVSGIKEPQVETIIRRKFC